MDSLLGHPWYHETRPSMTVAVKLTKKYILSIADRSFMSTDLKQTMLEISSHPELLELQDDYTHLLLLCE